MYWQGFNLTRYQINLGNAICVNELDCFVRRCPCQAVFTRYWMVGTEVLQKTGAKICLHFLQFIFPRVVFSSHQNGHHHRSSRLQLSTSVESGICHLLHFSRLLG